MSKGRERNYALAITSEKSYFSRIPHGDYLEI